MPPSPIRVAIVGVGKIARDQHLPAIAADPAFRLAALVSGSGQRSDAAPTFPTLEALLASEERIDAVALCTPPGIRRELAELALGAGLDVLMEKPPTPTSAELSGLAARARTAGRTLFATWHSRFNPAVEEAMLLLAADPPETLRILWKEDVRRWHPGQDWVLEADGFGVFDPGINALSILTLIWPGPIEVGSAELDIPANRTGPIAARLGLTSPGAAGPLAAEFDWLQTGPQTWTIEIGTRGGRTLTLAEGGARLLVDGAERARPGPGEYPLIYRRFAELVATRESDVDATPLALVEQAFAAGRRRRVAPFAW